MSNVHINIDMSSSLSGSNSSAYAHFAHDEGCSPKVMFVEGSDGCRDFITISANSPEQRAEVEFFLSIKQARDLVDKLQGAIAKHK